MRSLFAVVPAVALLAVFVAGPDQLPAQGKMKRPQRQVAGSLYAFGAKTAPIGQLNGAVYTYPFYAFPPCWRSTGPTCFKDAFHGRYGTFADPTFGPEFKTTVGGFGVTDIDLNQARVAGDGQDWTTGPWTWHAVFTVDTALQNGQYPKPFRASNYVNETTSQGYAITLRAPDASPSATTFSCEVFRNNNVGNWLLASTSTWAAGNVYTVTCTSDGAATRRIYVNGVQEATATTNLTPVTCTDANCKLQADSEGGTGRLYTHLIMAWARELTANEVRDLYANPDGFIYLGATPEHEVLNVAAGAGALLNNPVVVQ